MKSNIANLVKINLLSRFGFNEARYSKDPAKKRRLYLMMAGVLLVGGVLLAYILAFAWALLSFGAGECVPAYLMMAASLVIFLMNVFKAGSILFQMQTYEMLIALPLTVREITVSRFLTMYLEDLLLAALTVLPGSILYAFFMKADLLFWLMTAAGIFVIPLFPLVLASLMGVFVTAAGARVRHRNMVSLALSVLGLVVIMALLYVPTLLHPEMAEQLSLDDISSIGSILVQKVNSTYFLAGFYHKAVILGDIPAFLGFLAVSFGTFFLFLLIAEKNFVKLCNALAARKTGRNYQMGAQTQKSVLLALYQKEIKRYFSSNVYVMNTAAGYIMMLLVAALVAAMGVAKLEEAMQMPGIIGKLLPFLLGWMAAMSPMTASAISLEGKNWWIPMSLPVTARDMVRAKILVNLTVGLPMCALSAFLAGMRFLEKPQTVLMLLFVPAAYCIFSSVYGIWINEHMPMMKWDNEIVPIKQSGAMFVVVFSSFALAGLPIGAVLLSGSAASLPAVAGGTVAVLWAFSFWLYHRASRFDLQKIEM